MTLRALHLRSNLNRTVLKIIDTQNDTGAIND